MPMILSRLWIAALTIGLLAGPAAAEDCDQPRPVCAARDAVFRIKAFDPVASAVRIGPDTLVTARHAIADVDHIVVFPAVGEALEATAVPSAYPGDIMLLRVTGLPDGPALQPAPLDPKAQVFTVGVDVGRRRVRAYDPGRVTFPPAPGHPLARLHHDAYSQPGNSGGAVVDAEGRLVGIVASGGEGRSEAVPAAALTALRAKSGDAHKAESKEIGAAVRICTLNIEDTQRSRARRLHDNQAKALATSCRRSRNRQLFDEAAKILGRTGRTASSIALLETSLAEDPNAVNSRLSLVVSLSLGGRYEDAVGHIRWLMDHGVEDMQVLRFGIQAGVWGGDRALAQRAYDRLQVVNPGLAERAKGFLDNPPPRPKPRSSQ